MSLKIRITPDPAKVFPDDPRIVVRAQVSAINRSLKTGATAFNRRIRSELMLPKSFVDRLIRVTKANYSNIAGTIEIKRGARYDAPGIPLGKFGQIRTRVGGVSLKVRKSGKREFIRGAFLATMRSGRAGIWNRVRQIKPTTRSRRGPRGQELPIFERFGPTLTGYLDNAPGVLQAELDQLGATLSKNAASQIRRFLAKRK